MPTTFRQIGQTKFSVVDSFSAAELENKMFVQKKKIDLEIFFIAQLTFVDFGELLKSNRYFVTWPSAMGKETSHSFEVKR